MSLGRGEKQRRGKESGCEKREEERRGIKGERGVRTVRVNKRERGREGEKRGGEKRGGGKKGK